MKAKKKDIIVKIFLRECLHDGFIVPEEACKECSLNRDYGFDKKACRRIGWIEILPEQKKYLSEIIDKINSGDEEWCSQIQYTNEYIIQELTRIAHAEEIVDFMQPIPHTKLSD